MIKPDYEILENNQSKIIIEVKRLYKDEKYKNSKKNDNNMNNIEKHLDQQIKQLRTYCIFEKKTQMIGVITNLKEWVFTKYDIRKEFQNKSSVFECSKTISIFDVENDQIHFNKRNLRLILEALENLDKEVIANE